MTVDPSELLAQQPKGPSREQTLKTVMDKYPGHISWASDRANFAGCRVITYTEGGACGLEREDEGKFIQQMKDALGAAALDATPEEVMNLYFSTRANLLIVDMKVADGAITVLVTTQLDDEDLEEFNEAQTRVNLEMREWREEKAKEREQALEAQREQARFAELGRKWETYNLPGKLKELEAENAKLRKLLPEKNDAV